MGAIQGIAGLDKPLDLLQDFIEVFSVHFSIITDEVVWSQKILSLITIT
jgi:hypothetical protein